MPEVIATAVLPKCASSVALACAEEPGRFALHCVQLTIKDGVSSLKATDGRMLAIAEINPEAFDTKIRGSGSAVVLIDGVDFLDALRKGDVTPEDPARVEIMDDGSIRFDMPRWTVVLPASKRQLGAFPPFDEVVPSPKHCAGIPKGESIGYGTKLVSRAMKIAETVVGGSLTQGVRILCNGVKGATRLDVTGTYGTAIVCWMPMSNDDGSAAPKAPAAEPAGASAT